MSNQTIPNLTAATSLNGAEQLYAVQAGTDVRLTTAQIAALVQFEAALAQITMVFNGLPTILPATSGQLWNNAGVICIS